MASRAAMAARDAEVGKRLDAAVRALATQLDVSLPPPFPTVHDPAFRAIDEREWIAQALEAMLERLGTKTTRTKEAA